jgi:hypothetical protein
MERLMNFDAMQSPDLAARLSLPASAVCIRRNGIEFRSADPIGLWTEMTIGLEPTGEGDRFECTGVVVACNGNRQSGYLVALLFTNIPARSLAVLSTLGTPS